MAASSSECGRQAAASVAGGGASHVAEFSHQGQHQRPDSAELYRQVPSPAGLRHASLYKIICVECRDTVITDWAAFFSTQS